MGPNLNVLSKKHVKGLKVGCNYSAHSGGDNTCTIIDVTLGPDITSITDS
ncbi:hypothetical protein DFO77_13521 [Marinilabilia salmonicolor]|uniref:Uncharacterized protein n=1 Tax=Marinilabilia salmonicolor TaxID=989 RepID=A0A2T0WTH2_9BACT|nr:hypothetical protein BY457_1288 [Marinilabilia salmonicolor]RCW28838.1 hypothetical protein DFO77_13521 [Marinilabilia salmonicolor]